MEEVGQLFKGVLLTAVGLVIIYESYIYNLLDIIMLIGILTLFVGVIMLVMLFLTLDLDKQSKIVKYTKSSLNQKKNNLQNEKLTFKIADKSYYWFHCRNSPDSHVILCNSNPDPAEIKLAASLAAWYSQERASSKVEIVWTQVKNVTKIPGAKPGMVKYTDFHSLFIVPSPYSNNAENL